MEKFVVRAEADLTFEIYADNAQSAIDRIADAFRLRIPRDPLADVKLVMWDSPIDAELKTTVIQDWSVEKMEVEKA